jgi:aminoglycoside phosphotransferase (APT) family kinase protein
MSEAETPAGAVGIDTPLVRRLVATQFPHWAALPVRPVAVSGWDNRTFHLGEHMSVRLPSGPAYALQVEKEHRWLPRLSPHLPLPIPTPLGMGEPTEDYPWHWSVYGWIEGETAAMKRIADPVRFATKLAAFLRALQQVDGVDGPPPGRHNWLRGAHPSVYDSEAHRAIIALEGEIDTATAAGHPQKLGL